MPTVTSPVPVGMSQLQRASLVMDVTSAFDAKMRCGDHGKMVTRASLAGDVLTCEVCCQPVVPDVRAALAIVVRKAANAS